MAAAASFVIVIQVQGRAPEQREFSQPRSVIGREIGDLVLPDPSCSSQHAELLFDGGTVWVRDLGSTNGTWLNGQRVTEMPWAPGATLQIGQHALTLAAVRTAGPSPGRTVALGAAGLPPGFAPTVQGGPPGMAPMAAGMQAHAGAVPAAAGTPPGGAAMREPTPVHLPAAAGYVNAPPMDRAAPLPKRKGPSLLFWALVGAGLLGTCGVLAGGAAYFALRQNDGEAPGASTGGAGLQLTSPREASVKAVWFSGSPGPNCKGGTSPTRIRVGPNKSGTVSVAVAEEFAGGSGNQWRTATWLAAFNAARATGASLGDYEFSVHVGGHIDGPSAGMLTTAAMLALVRGRELRTDSTMTGTINPDGTAGPVGGIVQKMEGAKEAGIKRFGFPIGTRNHKDMKTLVDVDLIATAQRMGLEAKEISDLYEAYEFMTGDKLERVEPIAEPELELSPQTEALVRAKLGTWKARIEREIAGLKSEQARSRVNPEFTASLLKSAERSYDAARRYERNNFLVSALNGYVETAINVMVASRATTAVGHIANKDLRSLLDAVQTAQNVKSEVASFGQELEVKAQSKTLGGQISAIAAYQQYVLARSATSIGDEFYDQAASLLKSMQDGKLKITQDSLNALMTRVSLPTMYYDAARVFLDYAKDTQNLIADEGSAQPMASQVVDRTASGYASASAAVLAYFDALIIEELAKEKGASADEMRYRVAMQEPDYYLARTANGLSEHANADNKTDGAKLMKLAAASYAYLTGAKLVNKAYSLSGHEDAQGNLILENRRALSAQLDLARRSAREAASRAKAKVGFIPNPARLAFHAAAAQREGNDEEKLNALYSYWESTFWSELAATGG
jgi:uncharacterized protein